jgi:glycosyltransferase involved in cell wall biosynthesis
MSTPTQLVLFHTMDPRGAKLGGIETHVRLVLKRHPVGTSVLFVGIDERGDLELGRPVDVDVDTRRIVFLPVAHVPAAAANKAASRVFQSTTLRYALGLIRYLRAIRRATRGVPVSAEIERFEFALVPKILGIPLVMLVHNEGSRQDAMDSLLKRYWFLHLANERLSLMTANKVFAVNPAIAARVARLSPRFAKKTEVMSVSVDTRCFVPTPFVGDDAFHVCFAGRLDAFKDPPLMFRTLDRLAAKLAARPAGRFRRLVFDYVGASDPTTVPEFEAIAGLTVRHGIQTAPEVAAIMRRAHAGIVTSFFEGMPCYVLEMLASGRPLGTVRLPQLDPVIVAGVSGDMVERADTPALSAERLSDVFVDLVRGIEDNRFDPIAIAALARPFSVEAQMHRLFDCHMALASGRSGTPYAKESIRSA